MIQGYQCIVRHGAGLTLRGDSHVVPLMANPVSSMQSREPLSANLGLRGFTEINAAAVLFVRHG